MPAVPCGSVLAFPRVHRRRHLAVRRPAVCVLGRPDLGPPKPVEEKASQSVKHQPNPYTDEVRQAGFEPATDGL